MVRTTRIALLTLLLTVSAAPALAAMPRVTGTVTDYVLMPFLGYLSLVAGAWAVSLIARLRGQRT
jgi:hypothetical protein